MRTPLNLPNLITLGRIVLALVVGPMILYDGSGVRIAAMVVFLVAAFSDLWDGHLARSRNLITDFGKLMDPLADKLLLAATTVPFYFLSHGMEPATPFPWFGGTLPLWILLVIFGREIFITLFRGYAARRGVVLAAGNSGKLKAVCQNIFAGAAIMWYALHSAAREQGWAGMRTWDGLWVPFHRWFTIVSLVVAVALTLYSMMVYLNGYRKLNFGRPGRP